MVLDPCALDTLVQSSKCLNCLSKTEKQWIKVRALAEALKALGGLDLTDANALLSFVACTNCEPDAVLESINTQIALTMAGGAGGTVPDNIADLRIWVKCLVCADPKSARSAETVLRCRINTYIGDGGGGL